MRQLSLLFGLLGLITSLSAQSGLNFWKPVAENLIPVAENAERKIQPLQSKTFQLDYASLKTALEKAPMEFTNAGEPLLLTLPQADGSFRSFRIWESPVMAPELSAQYPEIRTFAGTAADGSGLRVRLGVGYNGFHSYFFGADGRIQTVYPYAEATKEYYMAYRMEDLPNLKEELARCGVEDAFAAVDPGQDKTVLDRGAAPANLRKYRAAISAQAEYSLFHGGTKTSVTNAITTALNFIKFITERDFAVSLELIAKNDTLLHFDPATDPFSGALATDWFNQNPAATNARVDVSDYDIGHVFCRVLNPPGGVYVAGIASLGGVCTNTNKARAASSLPSPIGEGYYLVVAHEMGHQVNATHTFNSCPPSEDARTGSTAFEPGGGSTIMSYATTCTPDIVDDRDAYFHVASMEQARLFSTQGGGSGCGEVIQTGNNAPEVNIPLTNGFYIPISTPFALTGVGTDVDGDNLSYCWEQYDLGPITPLGQPTGEAPLFRSFPPTSNPTRTFPQMQTIINNASDPDEYLPDYNRFINFRLTVRDGKGGAAWDNLQFRSTTQAGPFRVSYPSGSQASWVQGEYEIVTWDVANTDKAPVNCKKVNIKLSTDGGQTYPVTLAAGVANTGRYCIKVPAISTTTARVRVEAADNVFFDISNANFRIGAAQTAGFSLCPSGLFDTICLPTQFTTTISTSTALGFSDPITLSVEGLPSGATATITPNPVVPGSDAVLTLDFLPSQPEISFDLKIKAVAAGITDSVTSSLAIYQSDFSGMSLNAPADGAGGQDRAPLLLWNGLPIADRYEVQVATNPSFAPTTIVVNGESTNESYKIVQLLEKGTVYYWRFRAQNECGYSDWVGPFVFATLVDVCADFISQDVPKPITASQAVTVESKINVAAGGIISDVNVTQVKGNHAFFRDLEIYLVSPAGTVVQLHKNRCANNVSFNFGFDDSKSAPFSCPPPNNGETFKPDSALSKINGEDSGGDWILRVRDNTISSGGSITDFHLQLCSSTALNPPVLVNNNVLQVVPRANAAVTTDLLKTTDPNNTDDELVYTLMTVPQHGELQLNWDGTALKPGDQFTQTDLNNNRLRYFDYGTSVGNDHFCFTVTDGEGGLVKDCFTTQPFPVSANEAVRTLNFLLSPNPATETVQIAFGEAPGSDTRIRLFDASGRLMQTEVMAGGQAVARLNVANLPEGVYTLALDNAQGSGVQKLVVR